MYRWCSRCNEKRSREDIECPVCGSSTDVELDVGDTLRIDSKREFRITRQLSAPGEAGMSAVYRAERKDRPEMYGAIKLAKLNKVDALKREAEVLQKLQHPHIIRLVHPERALWEDHQHGETLNFFALEYMDGGSLKDRLKGQNKMALAEAVPIVVAVGQALEYAHAQGFVHLDVKPANILFGKDSRVVLSDFGIARDVLQLRKLKRRVGTLFYNSPEQLAEPPVHSHKADIFALGIILFEMLVGADRFRQYRGSSSKSSGRDEPQPKKAPPPLPSPRQLEPRIPVAVERVIQKAIATDPERRYTSVTEMLAELVQAAQQPAGGGTNKMLVFGLAGLAGLAALVFIFAGVGFVLWQSRNGGTPAAEPTAAPVVAVAGQEEVAGTPVVILGDASTPTPVAAAATATPAGQTADVLQPSAQATVTRAPTATPTRIPVVVKNTPRLEGRLELAQPDDNTQISTANVDVQWRWFNDNNEVKGCDDELPAEYGFQVRIWPDQDNANPPGVIDAATVKPRCDPETGVRTLTVENFRETPGIAHLSSGRVRWDVAVIELAPPYPARIQAPFRTFFY